MVSDTCSSAEREISKNLNAFELLSAFDEIVVSRSGQLDASSRNGESPREDSRNHCQGKSSLQPFENVMTRRLFFFLSNVWRHSHFRLLPRLEINANLSVAYDTLRPDFQKIWDMTESQRLQIYDGLTVSQNGNNVGPLAYILVLASPHPFLSCLFLHDTENNVFAHLCFTGWGHGRNEY